MYAKSKIVLKIKNRPNPYVKLIDTDSESNASVLLEQKGFRDVKELSYDTFEEYYDIAFHSTVTFIRNTKIVLLQIVGVHVHHPYGIGLLNRYPHYNTGLHILIVSKRILYFL